MGRIGLIVARVVRGFLLTVAFLGIGSSSNANAASVLDSSAAADEKQPPASAPPTTQALPAPVPGETLVYFFTSDSDATGTVIFLLNTDSVARTVALRGYNFNGLLGYSLNINLPATSMRRLASDSIVAGAPPSWTGPAAGNASGVDPIITNFTDFIYFASLSLPPGVVVDGYTIFNPGTGVVDPRLDQGAIPLRFMKPPFHLP
jgi:hypothetical protein